MRSDPSEKSEPGPAVFSFPLPPSVIGASVATTLTDAHGVTQMRTLSNLKMLSLLVLAGRFAHPEEGEQDGAGGEKGGGGEKDGEKPGDKPGGKPAGEEKPPIPYARFTEVNEAKRTAEAALKTATADVERLNRENEQLKTTDKTGALTASQDMVKTLEKQIEQIDKEFEDMLEVALAPLPKEKAAIVRDLPGGPRAQFVWFNKHRAALVGDESSTEDKGGPKGPKNEKKPPVGDGQPKASSATQAYVAAQKPAEKTGFPGLV